VSAVKLIAQAANSMYCFLLYVFIMPPYTVIRNRFRYDKYKNKPVYFLYWNWIIYYLHIPLKKAFLSM